MKRLQLRCSLVAVVAWVSTGQFSKAIAQMIEIPTTTPPIRLELVRSAHRLTLYRGDWPIRSYRVAVGRPGWETPIGDFHVLKMQKNPAWRHPLSGEIFSAGEPGNELGHYWIGFCNNGNGLIGFHDTPHPETVGKPVSHGCVRMFEKDIAELFRRVRVDTLVTVLP